jgi:hypothetical protein
MGGKAWQLKPTKSKEDKTFSHRNLKKSPQGGVTDEDTRYKRKPTRRREGRWFSHGLTDYQMWWEFLVRAEQHPDIQVDWKQYEGWGNPEDYQNIDVWSSKSRKDGFWNFWKTYGIELFAEREDGGIQVYHEGDKLRVGKDKFCLEIPTGTSAVDMMEAIKKLIHKNADEGKSSQLTTAKAQITTIRKGEIVRAEVRTDAFRRWLKIWDMKKKGYSTDEIDKIHGTGGKWNDELTDILYGRHNPEKGETKHTDKTHLYFQQFSLAQIEGMRSKGDQMDNKYWDEYKTTYREIWKAQNVIINVASGEFPGDTLKRKW